MSPVPHVHKARSSQIRVNVPVHTFELVFVNHSVYVGSGVRILQIGGYTSVINEAPGLVVALVAGIFSRRTSLDTLLLFTCRPSVMYDLCGPSGDRHGENREF